MNPTLRKRVVFAEKDFCDGVTLQSDTGAADRNHMSSKQIVMGQAIARAVGAQPRKLETLRQIRFDVGPASQTVGQRQTYIASMSVFSG